MSEKKRSTLEKKKAKQLQESPISYLPNEILTVIFSEANAEPVPISRTSHGKSKREDTDLPEDVGYLCMAVVISHVCGQWRALSLGIPALWTTFYHVSYMSNQHEIFPRLEAFLERSAPYVLDIWIDYRGTTASSHSLENMMEALVGHVDRWRSFILFHNSAFPFLAFVEQLKNVAAPNLETFCVPAAVDRDNIPSSIPTDPTMSPRIFKMGTPKLSLTGLDISGLQFYLPPLSSVASLYATNSIGNDGIVIMPAFLSLFSNKMDNLTNLTLDGVFSKEWHYDYASRPSLSMPNLIHLRISNQTIYRNQCPHWKMPLLETLTFYKVDFRDIILFQSSVIDVPNLHSLYSIDCDMKARDSPSAQFTSSVRKLVFSDSRWRSNRVRTLELLNPKYARAEQSEGRWPMLEDVTVNLRNADQYGLEFFLKCFEERPKSLPLTLRIDPTVLSVWRALFASRLALLENRCTIETLDDSIPYIPSPWPVTMPDGPFGSMLEKIDLPLIRRYPVVS